MPCNVCTGFMRQRAWLGTRNSSAHSHLTRPTRARRAARLEAVCATTSLRRVERPPHRTGTSDPGTIKEQGTLNSRARHHSLAGKVNAATCWCLVGSKATYLPAIHDAAKLISTGIQTTPQQLRFHIACLESSRRNFRLDANNTLVRLVPEHGRFFSTRQ